MSARGDEWWRDAFDAGWLRASVPFLTPERTALEVEGLLRLLPLAPPARIADIPSGAGRIARPLAERGFSVVGVDASEAQLAAARAAGGVRYVRADMRRLPLALASFDAALTLELSLGYGARDEDDVAVLAGIREVLKPGGWHVLDMLHREGVLRRFQPSAFYHRDGVDVHVARALDERRGRCIERRTWGDGRGGGTLTTDVRLYTADELRTLIARAGLELADLRGSYSLEPFTLDSPRFLALSRRPAIDIRPAPG